MKFAIIFGGLLAVTVIYEIGARLARQREIVREFETGERLRRLRRIQGIVED